MSYVSGLNTLLSSYSSSSISARNNRYKVSKVKFQPKDLRENNQQKDSSSDLPTPQNHSQPLVRISTGQKYSSHVASALLMAQEELSKLNVLKENKSEIKLDVKSKNKPQTQQQDLLDNDDNQANDSQESPTSYKDIEKKVNAKIDFSKANSLSYVHNAYNNTSHINTNTSYNSTLNTANNVNNDVGTHYNNFQFKNPVGNTTEYPFPDSPLGERTQSYVASLYMQTNNYLANTRSNSNNSLNSNNMYSASKL